MDEHAFVQTLESVLAPDNEILIKATAKLQMEYYKMPESLPILVNVIRSHPEQALRHLAAVEARTLVPKFWGFKNTSSPKLSGEVKCQVRESLLLSATQDEVPIVRHSAARVVSTIARIELPNGLWQDLPAILIQAARSQKADDREVATYILYTLLDTLEDEMTRRWQDFALLFSQTINDTESMAVRLNTLLALGKMAEVLNSDEHYDAVEAVRQLVPAMVAVLKQVAEDGDEEKSNSAFEVFQMLLIVDPAFTAAHFRDLIEFFSDMSINSELGDDIRTKALSFLQSCVRYKKLKLQALKVGPTLTERAMQIVTEFQEIADDDEMTPSRSALQLLDIMAAALPPSMVVVPMLNALPKYTNSPNPEYRKAGILALGHCVEGAPDFIVTQLDSIFPTVLRILGDPEARVRQAALEALMQLADDLHEQLGKEHAQVVPILINMLDSHDGPEILRRACNAIDAVVVGVDQADIEAYLPALIPKLSNIFQQGDFKLKAASVGAIGSTAIAAGTSFIPYFQEMMQGLSPYVSLKHSEEELDLRGIVTDCMGSIAEAVGLQAFLPYVEPLMHAADESLHLGHPRMKETAFMFFSTIAKIYGEEFKPFLEGTTKALFESLTQGETGDLEKGELELNVVNVGSSAASGNIVSMNDGDDDDDGEDNWDDLNSISAVAFEKEIAAETLGEILSHCKLAFLPYLEKTVEILRVMVDHYYEGIRKSAISTLWRAYATLWQVFEGRGMAKWQPGLPLKVLPADELTKLAEVVTEVTLENLKTENDKSTVTSILQCVCETLKLCGPAVLADGDGSKILELTTQLVIVLKKQHPAQLEDVEDEMDLSELQESSEYDWSLIESAMDVLVGLAVALGPQYGKIWAIVSANLYKYVCSTDPRERAASVGAIADSIKYMENSVTPSTPKLFQLLSHRLADEDQDTKANAAYGMGLLCYFTEDKAFIEKEYPKILQSLERFLSRNASDNPRILDNAAGCIARMIMASPQSVPLAEVLPALASILPLTEDYEENEPVYKMLVKLYQASNATVFNMTQQFVPIFAQVLTPPEEQLNDETRAELVELVKFLHSKEPALVQNFPALLQLVQQ